MYKDKKICAIVEARMTSSRLPGKVLMDIEGKPALAHIVERLRRSSYLDDIIIATTGNPQDDEIVQFCKKIGCNFYRGSENDVLLRVLDTAKAFHVDIIVEITGDCPVIDWRHTDYLIEFFFSNDYDYVSNTVERSFPVGFDTQVFPTSVLDKVNNLTQSPVDHEHVSLFIYTHPEIFKIGNWKANEDMYYPKMEITLDNREDYEMIKIIYSKLYPINPDFSANDVVELLLKEPEILKIVEKIKRKDAFEEQKKWLEFHET